MEELQPLLAFVKDQMLKSASIRLSDMDTSAWGAVQRTAGVVQKMTDCCFTACSNHTSASIGIDE